MRTASSNVIAAQVASVLAAAATMHDGGSSNLAIHNDPIADQVLLLST